MRYWTFADRPAATEPAVGVDTATFKTELKHAYDRGRADEHARRPHFGLLGFVLLLAALCGAGVIALAVQQGSFTGAGSVVDSTISQAGGKVSQVTTAAQQAATTPNTATQTQH